MRPLRILASCLLFVLTISCGRFEIRDIPEDPIGARGHIDLAISYEAGKEYDLALREYEKALGLDHAQSDACFGIGNIYLIKRDWPASVKHLEKAVRLKPSEGSYRNNLAIAYMEAGRLDDGLKAARDGLELDPARAYIYMDTLGMIFMRGSDTALAEKAYKEALTRATAAGTDETEILIHLQELYEATGDTVNAGLIRDLLKALELKKQATGKEGRP